MNLVIVWGFVVAWVFLFIRFKGNLDTYVRCADIYGKALKMSERLDRLILLDIDRDKVLSLAQTYVNNLPLPMDEADPEWDDDQLAEYALTRRAIEMERVLLKSTEPSVFKIGIYGIPKEVEKFYILNEMELQR